MEDTEREREKERKREGSARQPQHAICEDENPRKKNNALLSTNKRLAITRHLIILSNTTNNLNECQRYLKPLFDSFQKRFPL